MRDARCATAPASRIPAPRSLSGCLLYIRLHGRPHRRVTPPTACTFCGRENESASRFCIDCGKPMSASAARTMMPYSTGGSPLSGALAGVPPMSSPSGLRTRVPTEPTSACPKCHKPVDPTLPFCAHCGSPTGNESAAGSCPSCGASYLIGTDLFCARCGTPLGTRVGSVFGSLATDVKPRTQGPRVAVLDDEGAASANFILDRGDAVVGRGEADIRFEDDVFLSPLHARLELRDGALWVRDLGSRNGTWSFIDAPTSLSDGDVILVGSQLLRFRRLGYPGPHPPEADATRRMGSLLPSADVAVLEQLRADGSVRDVFHLSPARAIQLGRESGDWIFPYDPTMSGRHAEIRSQDAEFYVHDSGSRNGVALAVRGERILKKGQRVLVGDQILRVESV
ncbi:MAG: FHA domain-containing protein [bacterium]